MVSPPPEPYTTLTAYAPDAAVWGDEYISEKVETKAGWQYPAPEEDWIRGYPQELDDFVAAIAATRGGLDSGEGFRDYEAPCRTRDGRSYWLNLEGVPVRDAAGRVVQYIGVGTDVTRQKQAELALAEKERGATRS